MPATRSPGMDHGHYAWSALPGRAPLRWPGGARVAVCIVVNLEHYDMEPVPGAFTPGSVPGRRGRMPVPDRAMYTIREYGNRVGVFRVMKLLDRYGVRATAAIDATTAANYPYVVAECRKRQWEFAAHGHSVTQAITSRMTEDEERAHLRTALDVVREATGAPVTGWSSPEYCESARTPALLAELGVRYVLDWPNDEQPYRMTVPKGELVSLPPLLELDDVYAHWFRRISMPRWERMVQEAFDTLHEEGRTSGRLLTLNLHPWLIGQAHRIRSLEQVLAHMSARDGVWKATAGEIAAWYLGQEEK